MEDISLKVKPRQQSTYFDVFDVNVIEGQDERTIWHVSYIWHCFYCFEKSLNEGVTKL